MHTRKQFNTAGGTCGNGSIGNGICFVQELCCSAFGCCSVGPEFCQGPTMPAPIAPSQTPAVPTAPVIGGVPVAPSWPTAPVGIAPVGGVAPVRSTPVAPTWPTAPVGSASGAPTGPTAPIIAGGTCGNGSVGNGFCSSPELCCSTFGWCGVGPEFCPGPTKVLAQRHTHLVLDTIPVVSSCHPLSLLSVVRTDSLWFSVTSISSPIIGTASFVSLSCGRMRSCCFESLNECWCFCESV